MTTPSFPALQSSPALLFDESVDGSVKHVIVHPLVLLHILDHHTRRQEASGRVIGTLLGRRDGTTTEVTNCFAVPHAENGDDVAIGKDFNKTMLSLHLRSNRKEVVVGWYASVAAGENTPALVTDTTSLLHDFYSGESDEGEPVHLVVDTRLETDSLPIRAYKSTPVVVQGDAVGNIFHELPLSLRSSEPEAICMHEMIAGEKGTTKASSPDALQNSMEKLHALLETALEYVNDVVEGRVPPDAEIGRQIADSLATVPRLRPEVFDRIFHDSLQDLLMVTYLSNITRTQLTIAEKLNATLGVK
jgi:translation initiation factor 3 subunit F